MKIPGLVCGSCGSANLRRSKRHSVLELGQMALGVYPFRCLDCTARFWVSVWLFSKLTFAKCPKCLRTTLVIWPQKYYRSTLWRNLLITFGAHHYRCTACRFNFISFRPRQASPETVLVPAVEAAAQITPVK